MYCNKCDIRLDENVTVCPTCGNKVLLKRNLKIIFFIIFLIILVVIFGILIANKLKNKKVEDDLNNRIVEIKTISKDDHIKLNNFIFTLPKDLNYSNTDKYVYAATSDLKISFKMNVVNNVYDTIIKNYKTFIESIIKNGTEVISFNEQTVENHTYFLIATKQDNANYLYAITKLDDANIVQILINTNLQSGYETALSKINKIINDYIKVNSYVNIDNEGTLNDFLVSSNNTNVNIDDLFKVEEER